MDKTLKFKYTVGLTIAIILSATVFSLFFLFGSNGIFGKVIAPEQSKEAGQTAVLITQTEEKTLLENAIKKYEEILASPYMISVTKDNPLPENYEPELTELDGFPGIMLQTEAAQKLNEFLDEVRSQNIQFVVFAGYRTAEQQQQAYDQKRESIVAAGFTDEDIIRQKTQLTTDLPGYSEYQTGLAVDICQTTSEIASEVVLTEFYKYAKENIYKYGFILSMPENSYTGYEFMPWHFRYIGDPEQAKYINEKNLSLQSYKEYLQKQIQSNKYRLAEIEASSQSQ